MARPHPCDVPGCTHTRRRWQRLCERCFAALPGDIRTAIREHRKAGRKAAWRAECKRAAEHLAHLLTPSAHPDPVEGSKGPRVTAQQAFEQQQRLLGQRD